MQRLVLALLVFMLAGCTDAPGPTYGTEPDLDTGGPYSGDGTTRLVVAYFSFDIGSVRDVHGNMGGHCQFDGVTTDPPSVKVAMGEDDPRPAFVAVVAIHPDQDTDGISHFGTGVKALWRAGSMSKTAAFDHERSLGAFSLDGDTVVFDGHDVPRDSWIRISTTYTSDNGEKDFQVTETLHIRDFGQVPMDVRRGEWMCD